MTHPIAINDTLEITGPDGKVWWRLVHLGNGICNSERSTTAGTWEPMKNGGPLTETQITEWLKRKSA